MASNNLQQSPWKCSLESSECQRWYSETSPYQSIGQTLTLSSDYIPVLGKTAQSKRKGFNFCFSTHSTTLLLEQLLLIHKSDDKNKQHSLPFPSLVRRIIFQIIHSKPNKILHSLNKLFSTNCCYLDLTWSNPT